MFSDYFCGREDVKLPDKLFIRMDTIFKFSCGKDVRQGNEDDIKMSVKKQKNNSVSVPYVMLNACVYVFTCMCV